MTILNTSLAQAQSYINKNVNFIPFEDPPHKTKSGDTMASVSRQHKITVDQLKQWNPIYGQLKANDPLPEGVYLFIEQEQFDNSGKYTVVASDSYGSHASRTVVPPSNDTPAPTPTAPVTYGNGGTYTVVVSDNQHGSVKTQPVIDPNQEPALTPARAKFKMGQIGSDLNAYLSTLTPEQQVKFWEAYSFIDNPSLYTVAVRETTFTNQVYPQFSSQERPHNDNGQFVPRSAIERQAQEFYTRYKTLSSEIADANVTARINGVTTLIAGIGSIAMAVLSSESVVGAIYFGTVGAENIGSGIMQIWQGWEWEGDTPLSLTLELAGVDEDTARTSAFVVSTLPAGPGAYASAVKAINTTSKLTRVVSTVVATDQALTATAGIHSAATGEIQMPVQQRFLREAIGERGAALFNLTTTSAGQYNAVAGKLAKTKPANDTDVEAQGRKKPAGATKYGVFLSSDEAIAIKNPKINFAQSPDLAEMQNWVKSQYGQDHELIVGYGSGDLNGVWGNFQGMRGDGWIVDPKYLALDASPTLRYGIAKIQTTTEGTFLDPLVVSRSAQVSGTPKVLIPTENGLKLTTTQEPNAVATVDINRKIFAERLGINGVNDLNQFLKDLGGGEEARLYEVGSVYVSPDQRGGGYGYGISYLTKWIQNKVLQADYISSADTDNWSNSATTTAQTYKYGAVHPKIVYCYPTNPDGTGGIPTVTIIASDNPRIQNFLTNVGWTSMGDFKAMANGENGIGRRYNANFKLNGIEYQSLSEIPPMPAARE